LIITTYFTFLCDFDFEHVDKKSEVVSTNNKGGHNDEALENVVNFDMGWRDSLMEVLMDNIGDRTREGVIGRGLLAESEESSDGDDENNDSKNYAYQYHN
jgi:hypothetical protein